MIIFSIPYFKDWHDNLNQINNSKILNFDMIKKSLDSTSKLNNIIIPLTYDVMHTLSSNKSNKKVFILNCKNYETIKLLDDKYLFNQFMIKNSFEKYIPVTYFTSYDKKIQNILYPSIYKLIKTCGGAGSSILLKDDDLKKCNLKRKCMIQEYIVSFIEYAGHFLVIDGVILHHFFYKCEKDTDIFIQNGAFNIYTKISLLEYDDIFVKIFKKLNYTGFTCIDFKLVNNELKIFEINPRIGGSLVKNIDDLNIMIDVLIQYVNHNIFKIK